jgi:hypothetical protein
MAVTNLLVSPLAVPVIVTGMLDEIAEGAVKVVVEPMAVWAGLNEPQIELPQVTVQSAPEFEESLATAALIVAWAPASREAGGGFTKAMDTAAPVIITVATTLLLASAVAVAVMVTALPVGMTAGAVNVVAEPLAVCVGFNEPQLELPQVTPQSTPAFEASLDTVALIVAWALVCNKGDSAWVKAIAVARVVDGLLQAQKEASARTGRARGRTVRFIGNLRQFAGH